MKSASTLINNSHLIRAALVGHGISRSRTPLMHMAEGRAQGMEYQYDVFDTADKPFCDLPLSEILSYAESENYAGLNITHPFKVEVIPLLDQLSPQAKLIDAVNTVVFDHGKRIGHNTDYSGFAAAIQNEMADANKDHVLLLGAGGAGAAIALALFDCGVETLSVFDKRSQLTRALVNQLVLARPNRNITGLNSLEDVDYQNVDGVVNATPMGMDKYPGTAIDPEILPISTWVADIVYFPLDTLLLKRARQHGCRVMNGAGMAIYQAVDAFRLLTGQEPNPQRFTDFFNQSCDEVLNERQC